MSATATTEKKYLKWYQKLAYGSGDLASNCSYGLVSSFVLLYLTGTLGLDSAIIGSLMLASKVLDGISDVIFGTLIDRTHTLKVELEGAGILEAVGSANPCSEERYDTPESETFDGCCMAVVRAGEAAGEIHLTVTADDSVQKQLTILIQEAEG